MDVPTHTLYIIPNTTEAGTSTSTGAGASTSTSTPLCCLYALAEVQYYRDNLYEFLNAVKARVYVPKVWQLEFKFPGQSDGSVDPWHVDLSASLARPPL